MEFSTSICLPQLHCIDIWLDMKLILGAIGKLFDGFDARWERRISETQSTREQRVVPIKPYVDTSEQIPAAHFDTGVVTDNWGGLFDAEVVVDDWGGLFEQSAYLVEERNFDFSTALPYAPAPRATFSSTDDEASSTEPSFDSTAVRTMSDTVATLRCHADVLAKATPTLFASRAPRLSFKYQLPQGNLYSITFDDDINIEGCLPTRTRYDDFQALASLGNHNSQVCSVGNMPCEDDLLFSDAADHLFSVELVTDQNTEFRDINGDHVDINIDILVSISSANVDYYDDDHAFRNLTLASGTALQVGVDYDGEGKRVNMASAFLRMAKPSRSLLSTAYDLSTMLTDVPCIGSLVTTASKISSASFDAQVVFDEMQQRFRPRILIDASCIDMTTNILGFSISMSILIAPSAVQKMGHPDGELAKMRATASA